MSASTTMNRVCIQIMYSWDGCEYYRKPAATHHVVQPRLLGARPSPAHIHLVGTGYPALGAGWTLPEELEVYFPLSP